MTILHETVKKGRNIAASTRKRYLKDLDVWVSFAGDNPSNWTREKAQDFYDWLLQEKALKPQSANRLITGIQYASKWWAHKQNKPELDFAQVQKAPGKKVSSRQALDQVSATELIIACMADDPASKRDLAIVVLGLETGMRRMSTISMLIEQTYFERSIAIMYPQAHVLVKGSGDQRVPVPLSDTAIAAIEPWRRWLFDFGINQGPLFRGLDEIMGARGCSTTPSDGALSEPAIGKMLTRRSTQAGISHVYPHMFRHTFVTWRAAAGLLPHEIAAVTGHTIAGIGALAGYIDMRAIAEKVRNSTPAWLTELVARIR